MKPFDPFEGSFKCGIAAILLSLGIGFISFALAQQGLRSPAYVAQLQRPAAGGAYDPATDTDAIRWYRVEGTVGTNASNGAITNLVERKGIGYNFTNLTDLASGPIITNNYVNGKAAARSYGTNWLAMLNGSFSGVTEVHYFVVIRGRDDGTGQNGFWHHNGSGASTPYYPFSDGDIYSTLGTDTRKNVGNPAAALDTWRLAEFISKSGEYTFKIDGTQISTTGVNTVGFDTGSVEILFGVSAVESAQWNGDIAEIIVRDAEATGSTLTDIRTYFDTEYNLSY